MNGICPVCQSPTKQAGQTAFCGCGWSRSFNQQAHQKVQKSITKGIVIAGLCLMAGVAYLGSWGGAGLKIAPLKVRQWTGQLNKDSFARLKQTCMRLKKYDCVEEAHNSFFQSSGSMQVLEELGHFQYRRQRFEQAEETYHQYFTKKGKSVRAAYHFAQVLQKVGKKEPALAYYQYALKARPGTLQITVLRSYVDLLMETGKRGQAQQELARLKPMITKASALAQQEYERWDKQVNG